MSACLDSVCAQSHKSLDILVVDNGSSDGSIEFVNSNYPQVGMLRNRRNLGFAEGNNIGIRNALNNGADYVLLLNNDTVSGISRQQHCLTNSRKDAPSILCCRLCNDD